MFLLVIEMSAGELVNMLIGFTNDAESEMIITGIEGSFRYWVTLVPITNTLDSIFIPFCRYPQDFSYFIQNVNGPAKDKFVKM